MVSKETPRFEEEPARFIEALIKQYVAESSENRLQLIDGSPIWEEPLVGFADGEDPLFYDYRQIIGPFHLTPREVLEQSLATAPDGVKKDIHEISIICWALPVAKRTRASNARRDNWPSLRWSHTRQYGEAFNQSLRRQVVSFLNGKGYLAVAPLLSPLWRIVTDQPGGLTSTWSERHALYAAGMGTFSLSDGFITVRGIAHRCGSVVVNRKLPPTPRRYRSHTANCPFFTDKSCGVCIDRCPAGAITAGGHDKVLCYSYGHRHIAHLKEWYRVESFGCGLCQTGVPCESRIPSAVSLRKPLR